MSEWALKRFWKAADFELTEGGFEIRLDGRPVKTPAKRALIVPSAKMAQRLTSEWDAQEDVVDPTTMPWTRSANAAIDKVSQQRREVEDHLSEYAATDLLCYRAETPAALVARQSEAWDTMLEWVANEFGARLLVTSGVMPVTQEPSDIERLRERMHSMSGFQMTGFHDLVTLSGSYVLGLAVVERRAASDQIWELSRVDEAWQIEQWGEDEEASENAELKRQAFLHAADFFNSA